MILPTFLVVWMFFIGVKSGYIMPAWISSPSFQAGTISYTGTATSLNNNYIVTYSTPFTGLSSSLLRPIIGANTLTYQLSISLQRISLRWSVYNWDNTNCYIQISANTSQLTNIALSYFAYDVITGLVITSNQFTWSSTNPPAGPYQDVAYINFTATTGITLDMTHDNLMMAFINYQ